MLHACVLRVAAKRENNARWAFCQAGPKVSMGSGPRKARKARGAFRSCLGYSPGHPTGSHRHRNRRCHFHRFCSPSPCFMFRDSLRTPSRCRRCSPTTRPPALGSGTNLGSDTLSVRKRGPAKSVCRGSRLQELAL
ncbi:Pentatricopeptide repeat-containing protein mitochondrial [Zea mays]|jgi:hypothetical protein|uniref:Pentatricopeptide repeat-containing protein mitochondrial n=1 Tax=Zea mays TaxID=4577 RepID=A0A1D6FLE4_MAIZE|nr:Pentatricopeptide repeat-containing protein mitochondrial [Zea mays]